MIIDRRKMIETEQNSGESPLSLMMIAGQKVADFIEREYLRAKRILVLVGNGNNGGDGLVAAAFLKEKYFVSIFMIHGQPKTQPAKEIYEKTDHSCFIREYELKDACQQSDLILDAVYGFSFHGNLPEHTASVFRIINQYSEKILSIDINSGCECDSGFCDRDAIVSKITLALQYRKPFHALRKEHHMFEKCVVLDLDIGNCENSSYQEMNQELFFASFPKKDENAYKGTFGKTLLIAGSYGMAGAARLNILGAQTIGCPYLEVGVHDCIYPITASSFLTPVFHPFHAENKEDILLPVIRDAGAIAYGSGCTNLDCKTEVMDMVLLNSSCPVVLDAEGIRQLVNNTYLLRFVHVPVILTPHIGEFAALINKPREYVQEHREECASQFAEKFHVFVVLKGANTIVVSPDHQKYINESGCQALAQAGSGDLLTGMIAGILTFQRNIFKALKMAVWLHGYLSEYGLKYHSMQNFPLSCYPELMDELFRIHKM